ncbi:hypothetical protein [Pelomonas sp. KK5]|uniref:hypothetical protein n=1 Tax=Pelomonas sp. KK5 TaxID=1855730 RepID=UPI00097C3D76|nr:hypothetical protein [Pelomonas sp. KK5]
MARHQVIHIHAEAPPKPPEGQTCNGCGICCLAEPCPVGVVVSLKRHGACNALRWSDGQMRYVCGLMTGPTIIRRMVGRWIAAGQGCDCSLETETTKGDPE